LLRRHGCTSVHLGCEEGVCGACTVVVDGQSARSCLLLAAQIDGRTVFTVEGLAARADGARLQQAFVDQHAAQCGYCTPGFLMIALELLSECHAKPAPSEAELRQRLSAAICRCTGYAPILAAVQQALRQGHSAAAAAVPLESSP
jgi:carbon-monoxide dehydrogenase small subunit